MFLKFVHGMINLRVECNLSNLTLHEECFLKDTDRIFILTLFSSYRNGYMEYITCVES